MNRTSGNTDIRIGFTSVGGRVLQGRPLILYIRLQPDPDKIPGAGFQDVNQENVFTMKIVLKLKRKHEIIKRTRKLHFSGEKYIITEVVFR